ncbi:MAG: hypothetical protein PUG66_09605 [Clostridiales bacterium]|nr:hypothetical protein [Clostridiales bacterium]
MRVKGEKKRVAIVLAAALVVSSLGYSPKADAGSATKVTGDYSQEVNEVCDTLEYIATESADGAVGGDWEALILGRSGRMTDAWKEKYLEALKSTLDNVDDSLKSENKMDKDKSTENSRTIIGLYSANEDVTDFNGWNLCAPLAGDNAGGEKTEESADYTFTTKQGINGPVYALISMDYAGYKSVGETGITSLEEENTTTLRDDYISYILSKQVAGGGWTFFGSTADPDMTMMTVQALSNYIDLPEVKKAVEDALKVMSAQQNDDGGFASWGTVNAESIAQVICGLTMLGIDPTMEENFIKNGNTLVDALKNFQVAYDDKHTGYAHALKTDGSTTYSAMATQQAGYAMVALWCQKKGEKLYQNGFHDEAEPTSTPTSEPTQSPAQTPSQSPDVQKPTESPAGTQTAAPVTQAPTIAPATQAPSKAPATQAPTQAPATQAPSKAPATQAPTQAPATQAPSKAPATQVPSQSPETQAPSKAPATQTPTITPVTEGPTKTPAPASEEPKKTSMKNTTTVISHIVKTVSLQKGETVIMKAVVKGKKVTCKVVKYKKNALRVTYTKGNVVIKAKKKAKAGKTYNVVLKYKKGKKQVKKIVKVKVK